MEFADQLNTCGWVDAKIGTFTLLRRPQGHFIDNYPFGIADCNDLPSLLYPVDLLREFIPSEWRLRNNSHRSLA
jgi:hypothetical protein